MYRQKISFAIVLSILVTHSSIEASEQTSQRKRSWHSRFAAIFSKTTTPVATETPHTVQQQNSHSVPSSRPDNSYVSQRLLLIARDQQQRDRELLRALEKKLGNGDPLAGARMGFDCGFH